MKKFLTLIFLTIFSFIVTGNTPKTSLEEYIETWKDVAIQQMNTHGVPASITLSQGILESGFGNSKLAVKANNHFGIKCHDWKGETFLKDDDKRNECFRKYNDAMQSFEDHSLFLTTRSRYASLFELESTDYKAWAKGLKAAGYATNPTYDKKLIELIQRYDLNQYDTQTFTDFIVEENPEVNARTKAKTAAVLKPKNKVLSAKTTTVQKLENKRQVYTNKNRTKYVIAGNHDTFYQIAKEFGVSIYQLNRWNDFPANKEVLKEGDKIYIMRKRKSLGSDLTYLQDIESKKLWEISQEHGVQLKSLAEFNKTTTPYFAMNNKK
ncbi:MAG TPA: glucosaminidase domain-containing protein [Brumimicrobium sp.]|nr:glucosaminidase domain-containing protein [Brumimicrobium sp.]